MAQDSAGNTSSAVLTMQEGGGSAPQSKHLRRVVPGHILNKRKLKFLL